MAIYKNKVEWRGEHLGYTWMQNGVEMEFSAPPDLFGKAGVLTPEDAFVAAANTCYFMMVVWAAERFKMDLVSLSIDAEGEVEEHLDRTSWFKTGDPLPQDRGQGETQGDGAAGPGHGPEILHHLPVFQVRSHH